MRKMWQEGGESPFDDISDAKGDEIQKLNVIQTLPSLLAGDPQACIQRLMPKMQQTLPTASTEFHVAASSTFKTILEQRLVSHSTFTQTFLQSILNSLDSRDQIVAHAWLETLLDVIELLPTDVIGREILPVAINKGQLSQSVNSRIICCKLLGKICTRFDSQMIKKDVLPTVHSLCQDVNSDVRACICLQLHFVAEGLGPESVKSLLLSSIVELANDEEAIVRHASVQTIVYLLPHFQASVLKATISPLIKKSCENALKTDDTVICIIAQEFGKIVIGLEKCLVLTEKTWFLEYFQQLAQVGITCVKNENSSKKDMNLLNTNSTALVEHYVECRRLCAFNIPAMFVFASSVDVNKLLPTFSNLASDSYFMVRRAIACGIHEVAKILGPKNHLIKNEFIKLLKDDNDEVLQGLIPHIAQTVECLTQSKMMETEQEDPLITELGTALLKCEDEIFNTNNWRLSVSMLEQLEILPKCFPSEYIYTYFMPVAFKRALNTRPVPVRSAAGRLILIFTRYNLKSQQKNATRNRIYTEFARNPSCYVRMLFFRMMDEAMSIFSSNYFKEHFYSIVLSLSNDQIANIRLKLVTLLPTLKSYLRLPSDKKLLSSFESTVRNLMNNEKDRDVIFALTNAMRKLDEIDVRHEGQTSTAISIKDDFQDRRKINEEKQLEAITGVKSSPKGQLTMTIKKGPLKTGRINVDDLPNIKSTTLAEGLSKSTLSTSQKTAKQTESTVTTDSSFKASTRQVTGSLRSFDPSKASTSSDNLTLTWARLTSNRVLPTHSLADIDQLETTNNTNSTINNPDEDFISNMSCGCSPNFIYPDYLKHNNLVASSSSRIDPLRLTNTKENRHEYVYNYFLPSNYDDTNTPNFAALRAVTNAAQYNSCWAFSSMPEIPVTLLDDEFLVDTGVRIPAQLSSSQSTSKIPNLQDIIYRNTRINNVNKSRVGERSASVDQKSNKLSMNFDNSKFDSKVQLRRDKRYPVICGKSRLNSESPTSSKIFDDKTKRSSFIMDRDKKAGSSQDESDKFKRYSAGYKIPDTKYNTNTYIPKFKRHSVEVADYIPVNRMNKLKRNLTLDMNHNQGSSSKIPLRLSAASGSRTAPVTRASSPIRLGPQFDIDQYSSSTYVSQSQRSLADEQDWKKLTDTPKKKYTREWISKLPVRKQSSSVFYKLNSSDEELDKLCIRFADVNTPYLEEPNVSGWVNNLPVWLRRP